MSASHEHVFANMALHEQGKESYESFVRLVASHTTSLDTSADIYNQFESVAAGLRGAIRALTGEFATEENPYYRQMTNVKDVISEGLDQLAASKRAGIDYDSFVSELNEWKAIWAEQLYMG